MIRVICHWVTARAAGLVRPPTSPNGPHILFTSAQVAARRASWARAASAMLVCVTVGGATAGPPSIGSLPPGPPGYPPTSRLWLPPAPVLLLPEPTWRDTGLPVHPHDVPEPPAGAVLTAALAALFILRRAAA